MAWALVATIAVATTGCSGVSGSAPSVSTPSSVTPVATAPSKVAPVVAAHLAKSVPVRLQIAAIGVDSKLMDLGLKKDRTMEVPPKGFPAGWFTGAPTPGELGPAIIAGHVDWKGPGVFYDLHKLKAGDEVIITRKDGSKPVFRITKVSVFPKNKFPTNLVYGYLDHPGLRLITCGGTFDPKAGSYEDNIVAFADMVPPAG